jgi:hypothetical protein
MPVAVGGKAAPHTVSLEIRDVARTAEPVHALAAITSRFADIQSSAAFLKIHYISMTYNCGIILPANFQSAGIA